MIETPRLRLRPWHVGDLSNVQGILGDPDVMQFSDHGVLDALDQAAWLERAASSKPQGGLPGCMAIERRQDDRLLGYVSLSCNVSRVQADDAEIGFRLAKHAWNKGYATEAARSMIAAASATVTVKRLVALVDPNNRRSVRVLKKLGMKLEGGVMLDGYDYPDHFYVRQIHQTAEKKDISNH